jgi:hypothetical protein
MAKALIDWLNKTVFSANESVIPFITSPSFLTSYQYASDV